MNNFSFFLFISFIIGLTLAQHGGGHGGGSHGAAAGGDDMMVQLESKR